MIEKFFKLNLKRFLVLDYMYRANKDVCDEEIVKAIPNIHKASIKKFLFEFTTDKITDRTINNHFIISKYGRKVYEGIDKALTELELAESTYEVKLHDN
mgnify:CR=1 FL=1